MIIQTACLPSYSDLRLLRPVNKETMNKIRKTKNKTLAIPAAALTIPPNPKIAATMATTRNTMAQYSIRDLLLQNVRYRAESEIPNRDMPSPC